MGKSIYVDEEQNENDDYGENSDEVDEFLNNQKRHVRSVKVS